MKQIITLLFTLVIFGFTSVAQEVAPDGTFVKCGTDILEQRTLAANPELIELQKDIERHTQEWISNHPNVRRMDEILTIPVVVHIVHSTSNPSSNISDAQVYSQIEALNQIYRRQSADTTVTRDIFLDVAADCEMEFCLAQRDPDGYPTTGITRTASSVIDFEFEEMKDPATGGVAGWPTNDYLNIWVCNSIEGGSILGYAYRPGGAPSAAVDGFTVVHWAFGTIGTVVNAYAGGKTTAHELGHWLNLMHPWGNSNDPTSCFEDDEVDDTPLTIEPNFGCPLLFPPNQCSNETPDLPDMYENYMDYANDPCSNLFTLGQKARMRAIVDGGGYRYGLSQNTIACEPLDIGATDAILYNIEPPLGINNCSSISPVIEVQNYGTETLFYLEIKYQINDGYEQSTFWSGELEQFEYATITLPPINATGGIQGPSFMIHEIYITVQNPNGIEDNDVSNNVSSVGFSTMLPADPLPYTEAFNIAEFSDNNWAVENPDGQQTFELTSSAGYNDGKSTFINNYNYDNALGEEDDLISQELDLYSQPNPQLEFYVAYALGQSDSSDVLQILASIDCGETFNVTHTISGEDLRTSTQNTGAFVPADNEWKKVSVLLDNFQYSRNAIIKFRQIRGEGNNLYIDDINIESLISSTNEEIVAPISSNNYQVSMYPNPATNMVNLQLTNIAKSKEVDVTIVDKMGRVVMQLTQPLEGTLNKFHVNTFDFPAGMYLVNFNDGEQVTSEKLVIMH